jgi:hypothetical protein
VWAQNPDPTGQHPERAIREETWMGPGVRFAYLSYDSELSTNHSIKCRQLIESPWYQNLWGDRFHLMQNLKTHYNNDRGGERLSGTVHGITGFGANIFGYDDPHDLRNVESDVKRNEVLRFATEILPNRFNPEEPGALIVIMQRSQVIWLGTFWRTRWKRLWRISPSGRRAHGGTFVCPRVTSKSIRIRCALICIVAARVRYGKTSAPRKASRCGRDCFPKLNLICAKRTWGNMRLQGRCNNVRWRVKVVCSSASGW